MKAVFLVGAGFNVDTRSEAPRVYGQHRLECEYPLLSDLSRICFDVASVDPAKSIEEILAEAQLRGETEPLTRLANKIMSADYWIGKELTREGALNIYSKFFDRFDSSDFITFNYDSLIEIFLYHRNHWCPDDGYGVTVVTSDSDRPVERPGSTSLVLHLHGTFCLYMSDHEFIDRTGEGTAWYETLDPPRYNFDPYRIAKRFRPYGARRPPLVTNPSRNVSSRRCPIKPKGCCRSSFKRCTSAHKSWLSRRASSSRSDMVSALQMRLRICLSCGPLRDARTHGS